MKWECIYFSKLKFDTGILMKLDGDIGEGQLCALRLIQGFIKTTTFFLFLGMNS